MTKEELITALTSIMVRHRQRKELRDDRFIPSTAEDLELYATQYQNFLRLYTVNELEKWLPNLIEELVRQ